MYTVTQNDNTLSAEYLKKSKQFKIRILCCDYFVDTEEFLLQTGYRKPRKPTANKYPPDSRQYKAAVWFLDLIRKVSPRLKEPNLQLWAKDMNMIMRIDKRTPEDLFAVVTFIHNDSFWRVNILSPAKLRKQFDTILAKLNNCTKNQP